MSSLPTADPTTAAAQRNRTMSTHRSNRRGVRLALLAGAVVLSAAACSDDDDTVTSAGADEVTTTSTTEHEESEHDDVEVTLVDYAFEGLPERVDAGTRLTIANDAPAELHELVAIRLPDDEERSVEALLQLPEAELGPLLGAGPPAAVLLAPPGGEQIAAVGDGTLREPGRYLVMCAIPTGVAPDVYLAAAAASGGEKPEVEGGPPHFVHGMAAELVVE